MHRVMIHPADYADCHLAVRRAFELFPIVVTGRKVLVKPNVLRASKSDEAIATNPAVLRAVIDCLEEKKPAGIVVGDNPGLFSYGANEAAFKETGLFDAAKGYYKNIGQEGVPAPSDHPATQGLRLSKAVVEADVIISLPKFKTHGLTILTGAIKNSYGLLPGAQKAMLHKQAGSPERFHELVVEVFRLRVPDLFIIDAVVGMEGNGPASTELRTIGRIIASDNAVALDSVMARMAGLDPGVLRFLRHARAAGLGDFDPQAVKILGELTVIPDFKLPPLSGEAISGSAVIQEFLASRTRMRPRSNPETCTVCGLCVDQCPAQALTLTETGPVVNDESCIACFCCQEMCPTRAIVLS